MSAPTLPVGIVDEWEAEVVLPLPAPTNEPF